MTTQQKKKFTFGAVVSLAGLALHLFLSYTGAMLAIGSFIEKEKGVYVAVEKASSKQDLKDTAISIRKDIPVIISASLDSIFTAE